MRCRKDACWEARADFRPAFSSESFRTDTGTANGDNVAKFALALGAAGNVHTRTCRAWTEPEYMKIISELP